MKKLFDRQFFRTRLRSARHSASFTLLAFALCSCSEKKDSPSASSNSGAGKLVIKGSNTIGEELGPRLIAEYKKEHPDADIAIESKATGYGFAALLAGQCDLAAASRTPIKDELELAQARGFEFKDYPIGAYSVAVIVNANCPVKDLTREQVRDIFTGVVQNWKDLGGPDSPINLYIRDPISGTYLGFRELAMENKPYGPGMKTCTNYLGIAEGVAQDPAGIGYTGLDLTTHAGVKAVSISGISPTAEAVNGGKYPYARKLQFYTHKGSEGQKAVEFVQFVQSSKGQEIVKQMGYVPHP